MAAYADVCSRSCGVGVELSQQLGIFEISVKLWSWAIYMLEEVWVYHSEKIPEILARIQGPPRMNPWRQVNFQS